MKTILFLLCFVGFGAYADYEDDTEETYSRLAVAVEMDDLRTVKRIIENGEANINEMVKVWPYSDATMPIISVAARAGSEKVAEYLIQSGADLNAWNHHKETPLMFAVYFDDALFGGEGDYTRHDRVARMLIDHGANLENGPRYSPLPYAAYKGRIEIGQYMLDKGADVNGPLENGISPANTPLMMATMEGKKDFVLMLFRHGADASIVNHLGNTALSLAHKYKRPNLIGFIECALSLKAGELFQDHCE